MLRTRSLLLWIIPLLALITLSLIHQSRHPETLGQRMISILQRTPMSPRLRGALPLTQTQIAPPAESPLLLRPLPTSSADRDFWEAPNFTLHRLHETSLLRQTLQNVATQQALEQALSSLGYVNQKPRDLFTRARDELLALSDENLLLAILQADIALLQQSDDPAAVTKATLLLTAWDPTGISACVDIPTGGRLYAIETLSSLSPDSWNLVVIRFDSQSTELWHGTLHMARLPATPLPLSLLVQSLPQLETPAPSAPSPSTSPASLLFQPPQ